MAKANKIVKKKDPLAKLHAGMALLAEALREADEGIECEDYGLEWRVDVASARHDECIEVSQLVSIGVHDDGAGKIVGYRFGFANFEPVHIYKSRRNTR